MPLPPSSYKTSLFPAYGITLNADTYRPHTTEGIKCEQACLCVTQLDSCMKTPDFCSHLYKG